MRKAENEHVRRRSVRPRETKRGVAGSGLARGLANGSARCAAPPARLARDSPALIAPTLEAIRPGAGIALDLQYAACAAFYLLV